MAKMLKKEMQKYRQILLKIKERISDDIKHISEDTLKIPERGHRRYFRIYSAHG